MPVQAKCVGDWEAASLTPRPEGFASCRNDTIDECIIVNRIMTLTNGLGPKDVRSNMLDVFIVFELRRDGMSCLTWVPMWKALLGRGKPSGRSFYGRDHDVKKVAWERNFY